MVQLSHLYMTTGKIIGSTIWTFVDKVMSLLFNMLSRFVIAFLPRSKCLFFFFFFLAAGTICSDFGTQENKVCHCLVIFYWIWWYCLTIIFNNEEGNNPWWQNSNRMFSNATWKIFFLHIFTLLFRVVIPSVQFSSAAQLCLTLGDPMSCSTLGLPVQHQLLEPIQTHVHWVRDAIQPSHPLSSPSPPALNLSQHQGLFQWVSSLYPVAKVLEFQLQHQSFQWTPKTDLL